jgi:hypothetical protein
MTQGAFMSRMSRSDIILELAELSKEVSGEIGQQLTYYRVSVYKNETAALIKDRIDNLKVIASLFCDEMILEPFSDYDATVSNGNVYTAPGECAFSARVGSLLKAFSEAMEKVQNGCHQDGQNDKSLASGIQKHRRKILSLCKQGTRQWAFFNSL